MTWECAEAEDFRMVRVHWEEKGEVYLGEFEEDVIGHYTAKAETSAERNQTYCTLERPVLNPALGRKVWYPI